MYIGNLQKRENFLEQYPGFKQVIDFLEQMNEFPAEGIIELDGKNVFACVQEYDTLPLEDIPWEFHRKHIDIQYIHSGHESIGVALANNLSAIEYKEAEDIALSTIEPDGSVRANLHASEYIILFPEDAHKPRGNYAEVSEHVQKIVFKIKT